MDETKTKFAAFKEFIIQHKKLAVVIAGLLFAGLAPLLFSLSKKQPRHPSLAEIVNQLVPRPFADVIPQDENFTAIKYLRREGVLIGDENYKFNPQNPVTRAEWAEWLVRLTGVEPDPKEDRLCFPDVEGKPFEASVCYVWRQGWMASAGGWTAPKKQSFFQLVEVALANESEVFAGTEPVTKKAAVGSLARATSWTPAGVKAGEITDEQAVEFAERTKITAPGASEQTLNREEGAVVVFKTLATVPFGAEEYQPKYDSEVVRRRAQHLADATDRKTQSGSSREARIKHWAENSGIGVEAATQVVDTSSSREEELAKVRKIRYQMRLAEEKRATWGKDTPTFDAFEPLREIFQKKGFDLSMDDVTMKVRAFDGDMPQETRNSVVKARDNVSIRLALDANFNLIPGSEAGTKKIAYIMSVDPGTHYDTGIEADFYLLPQKGRFVGDVSMEIIDVETAVVQWKGDVGNSLYYMDRTENISEMYQRAMRSLETRLGQSIRPPPAQDDNAGQKDWKPVTNKDRRIKTTPRAATEGQPTSWGSAQGWETAYENYFWVHVQHPDFYPSFWNYYGDTSAYNEYIWTLPVGGPVDLRAYFDTPGVKEYYKDLRKALRENSNNPVMQTLEEFLANIDSYQANLEMAKPEKQPEAQAPEAPEDTSTANPETEELLRKMRECYSRPLPETESQRQEQLRQDMTPGTPCYNSQIKRCKDGSYGLCLNDSSGSGWVESR